MTQVVEHVVIIMDGNGRWAQRRGRPRLVGHHAVAKRVCKIVQACPEVRIKYLTVFAFSTENWKRTQVGVSGLMRLFKRYIRRETQALITEGVRVRFMGDRIKLDNTLVQLIDDLNLVTLENSIINLKILLNYFSRDEVTRAAQRMAHEVEAGKLAAQSVTAEVLASFLDTHFLPDPDLVMRTSGEARISNFLLWQSAYAEYEFVETLWPDFTAFKFTQLISKFGTRDRRYGALTA